MDMWPVRAGWYLHLHKNKMKKIIIDTEDFKIIVDFINGITIPFGQSKRASMVFDALNRAKIVDFKEDIKEKSK